MDISAYVGHGWNTFKANPAAYVIGTLALMIGGAVVNLAGGLLPAGLGFVVGLVVSGLGGGAMAIMGLRGTRSQSVDISELAAVFKRPLDYIVVGLAVSIGFIGCGVGVFVTQALFMFAYFLVSEGVGYQDALKRSMEYVKPRFSDLLLLTLVVFVLNLAGAVLCGIGLLVSVPVGFLALAKAFEDSGLASGQGALVTPPVDPQQLP